MTLRDSSRQVTLMAAFAAAALGACNRMGPATAAQPVVHISGADSARLAKRRADSIAGASRRIESAALAAHEDSIRRREDVARVAVTTARTTLFAAVHFDPDRADIRVADQALLDRKAALLVKNPNLRLRIFGYSSDRGSDDRARQLGMERAAAVRQYLVARGVDSAHVSVASNGDARLLCRSSDDTCLKRNARDEFAILAGGGEITP